MLDSKRNPHQIRVDYLKNPKNPGRNRNGTSASTNGYSLSPRPSSANPEGSSSAKKPKRTPLNIQNLSDLQQRRIHRFSQSRDAADTEQSLTSRSEEISPRILFANYKVPSLFNPESKNEEEKKKPVIDILHQTDRKIKELEEKWDSLKRNHFFLMNLGSNEKDRPLSAKSDPKTKSFGPFKSEPPQ